MSKRETYSSLIWYSQEHCLSSHCNTLQNTATRCNKSLTHDMIWAWVCHISHDMRDSWVRERLIHVYMTFSTWYSIWYSENVIYDILWHSENVIYDWECHIWHSLHDILFDILRMSYVTFYDILRMSYMTENVIYDILYMIFYLIFSPLPMSLSHTGWRRLIESPKLKIIFHKNATKYRSLLQKMTYEDKGSYESSPPCISQDVRDS